MIDIQRILDLTSQSFADSDINWRSVTQGTFENLPKPEEFDDYSDGDYFALFKITSITPEYPSIAKAFKPIFNYRLTLMVQGRSGDITAKRNALIGFINDWTRYWERKGKTGALMDTIDQILPMVEEIEEPYDVVAIAIEGHISHITSMTRRIDG